MYQHDIQSTRDNDGKLCQVFGTIYPTEQQVEDFNNGVGGFVNPDLININLTLDERGK